jgi:hypothetical protein
VIGSNPKFSLKTRFILPSTFVIKIPCPLYFSFLPYRAPKFLGRSVGVVKSQNAIPGYGPGPGLILGQSRLSFVLTSNISDMIGFFIKMAP